MKPVPKLGTDPKTDIAVLKIDPSSVSIENVKWVRDLFSVIMVCNQKNWEAIKPLIRSNKINASWLKYTNLGGHTENLCHNSYLSMKITFVHSKKVSSLNGYKPKNTM